MSITELGIMVRCVLHDQILVLCSQHLAQLLFYYL